MATIKKTVIKKKVGSTVYALYPKTSSDIVTHTPTTGAETTVAALLNSTADSIGSLTESTVVEEIDAKILAFKKEIYGVDNDQYKTGIAAALDTIKEIADILGDNESASTVLGNIATLKTEVETANTGLLDRTTALEHTVNGYTPEGEGATFVNGLVQRVAALESFNGAITTDDVPVGTDEDRNYVTTDEKTRIANAAVVQMAAYGSADSAFTSTSDLYFEDLTAPVNNG